jgi:hypothetical protein
MTTCMRADRWMILPLVLATVGVARAADAPPPSPSGKAVTDAVAVVAPTQGPQAGSSFSSPATPCT